MTQKRDTPRKCPRCGKLAILVPSNNPMLAEAATLCEPCLNSLFDPTRLTHANFFCRTYNFPFDPNEWQATLDKAGSHVWAAYAAKQMEAQDTLAWQPTTPDKWGALDEEWQRYETYEALLAKVDKVKEAFLTRATAKWGEGYSFPQLLQLENLLVSTLRAHDITNPLQIDAIKKACRISVELDKAIEAGDGKSIKELAAAYSSFTKTAQIDDIIAESNGDVIATVADLADYIEKCGGQFHFYDNVERDVVDRTINDLKEYIRTLVTESTGLTTTLERIAANYQKEQESAAADAAREKVSLEEILEDTSAAANAKLDSELAAEEVDVSDLGEDDEEADLW